MMLGALTDRILLVDKPPGCTSHDVVLKLRRFLGQKRIGHAGTLDPFATGLLVVLVGRGTKLFPMLSCLDKVYEGVLTLGVETSTGDPMGEVVSRSDEVAVSADEVAKVVASLVGEQDQVPPMTSAVKYNGQPLYKLSRKGLEVPREPRRVNVYAFDVLGFEGREVRFRIACSKGTYIRTLATDFGQRLGVGAHLTELRRTRVGVFRVEDAVAVDDATEMTPRDALVRHGLSLSAALGSLSSIRLNPSGVRKVRCGVYPTPADLLDFKPDFEVGELVQLLDPAGELVAVGRSGQGEEGRLLTSQIELVRVI